MKLLTFFTVAYFLSTFMTICHISASPYIKPRPDILYKPDFPGLTQVPDHPNDLENALVGVMETHFDERLHNLKNHFFRDLKEMKSFVNKSLKELKDEIMKLTAVKSKDMKTYAKSEVQGLDDKFRKMLAAESKTIRGYVDPSLSELKDQMEKQIQAVEAQNEMLKAEDEKIENLSECTSPKVAFTATLKQGGNLMREKDVTIKYEQVLLNENEDYNNVTGVFTAKEPGLYLFTLHVTGSFERWADLYIAHNDQKVTAAFATGFHQNRNAASTDAVLQLKVGDTVQVKTLVGKHDRKLTDLDGTLNSFSGVLIKSDRCNALFGLWPENKI